MWLPCGLAAILVLAVPGCGGTGDISGRVSFKGTPLSGGRVTFTSPQNNNASVYGLIGEGGRYQVTGCPAGPVRITVQTVVPRRDGGQGTKPGPGARPASSTIPVRYADPDKSGLDYNVRRGRQEHDIDLQP
jgi:hypothetical protein